MCKRLGPVQVRCSKYPLLLLKFVSRALLCAVFIRVGSQFVGRRGWVRGLLCAVFMRVGKL